MDADRELAAMQQAVAALSELDDESRQRVLHWLASRLGVPLAAESRSGERNRSANATPQAEAETFADFYHQIAPSTDKERAIVGAYWLRQGGASQFQSQELNALLKDLGHRVPNITDALSAAMAEKPALVIQVRKSGTSRQARKHYKLTDGGAKWIESRQIKGEA